MLKQNNIRAGNATTVVRDIPNENDKAATLLSEA